LRAFWRCRPALERQYDWVFCQAVRARQARAAFTLAYLAEFIGGLVGR
jgi:hypothetical protein